jgi:PIN domain nuclease of toxin-antitoxin system
MKKILLYATLLAATILLFNACSPKESGGDDWETNLCSNGGEWVSTQTLAEVQHQIHDQFRADHTGTTWSETDNVKQAFKWELSGNRLTFIHYQEMTGEYGIPLDYTVTTLNEHSLVYKDEWGKTISCAKVRGVE